MSAILRQYQVECISAIKAELMQKENALIVLPTGSGKTLTFSHLLQWAIEVKPDLKAAIVMGRVDLVSQTEKAISRVLPRKDVGVYCGSMNRRELSRSVTVASIQSISEIDVPHLNLLIVDEVHNLDQKKGAYLKFIEKAQAKNPRLKIVGFTATAFRSDGVIYGTDKLFSHIAFKKTLQEMIDLGHLVPPILKHTDAEFDTSSLRIRGGEYRAEDVDLLVANEEKCIEQVRDALSRLQGRQCIAFATANIDHCSRVTDILTREGERATQVHSKQDRSTRDSNLAAFMGGSCRHMVFVSILSEGFDHPPIDAVVVMRPTRSPVLYVQTIGRGLRPYEDKKNCLVLDYGRVVAELGPLDNPKVKGKREEKGDPVLKCCPTCQSYCPGGCAQCPDCGHAFPPPPAPEEKLAIEADSEAVILSKQKPVAKPETFISDDVYLQMHTSKAGNVCVRITYGQNSGVVRFPTSEYFAINSPWAMDRLERRLDSIGVSLPGIPFEEEVRAEGRFLVEKVKEGKYDRVTKISRCPETPESSVEDTSFNFGFNTL